MLLYFISLVHISPDQIAAWQLSVKHIDNRT